ncbi:MAG: hypothetical protein GX275_00365 [Clostridiales bacterium]|nr:hypothetical protein [Clostridiales bacterium]
MDNNGFDFSQEDNKVMTVGQWVITILVYSIPCVNIVMMFVWAFGSGNNNRKNYSRAMLIYMAIGIVLYLIFFLVFGAAIFGNLDKM